MRSHPKRDPPRLDRVRVGAEVAGSPVPCSSTIHGTVIRLVVDARTGQITDSGLSDRYPPLAQLGRVTTDLHR